MPGFDGTGPGGMGPMTGGGRGFCVAPVAGMRPRPFGRRSFGRGCGRGWRNQFYTTDLPRRAGGASEAEMLKEEAGFLKEELRAIEDRIETLEKAQASAG
ncbi:MAG: DUF5320 domain-containing protein [Candidatus Omnitrophota bacterium]